MLPRVTTGNYLAIPSDFHNQSMMTCDDLCLQFHRFTFPRDTESTMASTESTMASTANMADTPRSTTRTKPSSGTSSRPSSRPRGSNLPHLSTRGGSSTSSRLECSTELITTLLPPICHCHPRPYLSSSPNAKYHCGAGGCGPPGMKSTPSRTPGDGGRRGLGRLPGALCLVG